MFVLMSFSFGLAVFVLVLMAACAWTGRPLGDRVLHRLKNLLGVFVAAVLYMTVAYHLTNLYATEHHGVERFLLRDGGVYTAMFWIGQVLLGSLVPLGLFHFPGTARSRRWVAAGAALVVLGGLAQVYVIIIGGQAYPLTIFPGMEVVESGFFDGVVAEYRPSLPELLLGLGGVAAALLVVSLALKVLRFLPASLADPPGAESGG
jgi:molybdopterin-containing oxidoreductase family membrane subunit